MSWGRKLFLRRRRKRRVMEEAGKNTTKALCDILVILWHSTISLKILYSQNAHTGATWSPDQSVPWPPFCGRLGTYYYHPCPSASRSKHHELLFTCKGTWTRMLMFIGTDDRCSFPVLVALGLILFQDLETLDLLLLALPSPSPPLPARPNLDNSKSSSKTGSDTPSSGKSPSPSI